MKKNTSYHTIWIPICITFLASIVVFTLAEYVFHIPSKLFTTSSEKDYLESQVWTPRIPLATPPKEETGSVAKPDQIACTMEYAPVCGADGRDYSNACMARASGTIVLSEGNCKGTETVLTGSINSVKPTVSAEAVSGIYNTGSYHFYENKTYGYSLYLPKFAYYQGLNARDGSAHTLLVGTSESGSTDITTADVVVYFYKNGPISSQEGEMIEITKGFIYLVNHATGPKIDKILESIRATVR